MTTETILFVDDEVNVLNSLRRLFRKEKYEVLTCTSGAEALEILKQREVNVLIADQRMPEMTGTELLKIVKQEYPLIIRIILSGYSDIEDILRAINEGEVYRFLRKPDDLRTIRDIVQVAFEQSRLLKKIQSMAEELNKSNDKASYNFRTSYTGGMIKMEINGDNSIMSKDRVVNLLKALFDQAVSTLDLDVIGGTLVQEKGRMTLFADMGYGYQLAFELPIEHKEDE